MSILMSMAKVALKIKLVGEFSKITVFGLEKKS